MRKSTLVIMLISIFILSIAVYAQVTFTPPGEKGTFHGQQFTMLQSSVGQRENVTGNITVGKSTSGNQYAIRATADHLKNRAQYALVLESGSAVSSAGGSPTSVSYKVLKTRNADNNGHVDISWVGSVNPLSYNDIVIYYLPSSHATPGHGAIRLLSIPSSRIKL